MVFQFKIDVETELVGGQVTVKALFFSFGLDLVDSSVYAINLNISQQEDVVTYNTAGNDTVDVVKPSQLCWAGFMVMLMCVCVCVYVCLLTRYLKHYLTNQLHCVGSLPSDPDMK